MTIGHGHLCKADIRVTLAFSSSNILLYLALRIVRLPDYQIT